MAHVDWHDLRIVVLLAEATARSQATPQVIYKVKG